jgi:hypothetical protein
MGRASAWCAPPAVLDRRGLRLAWGVCMRVGVALALPLLAAQPLALAAVAHP